MASFTEADIGKQVEVDPAPMAGTYDALPSQVVRRADGKAEGTIRIVSTGVVCGVHQPILLVDFRTDSWWVPQSACALLGTAPVEARTWKTCAEELPPVGTRVFFVVLSSRYPSLWRPCTPQEQRIFEECLRKMGVQYKVLGLAEGLFQGGNARRDVIVSAPGLPTLSVAAACTIWGDMNGGGAKAVSSWPHKCPACGSPGLQLFASMECSSPGCKYHKDYVK